MFSQAHIETWKCIESHTWLNDVNGHQSEGAIGPADLRSVSQAGYKSGFLRTDCKLLQVKWDGSRSCWKFGLGRDSMETSVFYLDLTWMRGFLCPLKVLQASQTQHIWTWARFIWFSPVVSSQSMAPPSTMLPGEKSRVVLWFGLLPYLLLWARAHSAIRCAESSGRLLLPHAPLSLSPASTQCPTQELVSQGPPLVPRKRFPWSSTSSSSPRPEFIKHLLVPAHLSVYVYTCGVRIYIFTWFTKHITLAMCLILFHGHRTYRPI